MSATIPDINMDNTWIDVYAVTGIVEGTPLILKNKSSSYPILQIKTTSPLPSSTSGWDLGVENNAWVTVTNIPDGHKVWVKGQGPLHVQEYQ